MKRKSIKKYFSRVTLKPYPCNVLHKLKNRYQTLKGWSCVTSRDYEEELSRKFHAQSNKILAATFTEGTAVNAASEKCLIESDVKVKQFFGRRENLFLLWHDDFVYMLATNIFFPRSLNMWELLIFIIDPSLSEIICFALFSKVSAFIRLRLALARYSRQ